MATWAEFLAEIRADLQDTAPQKRWPDKTLWIYSKDAIRDYSTWFPMRVDSYAMTLENGSCVLPLNFIGEIFVEAPKGTFLEKREEMPGTRLRTYNRSLYYHIEGGRLYLNGPSDAVITYNASHPVPTSETDETFVITIPDIDTELIRLYVKAKVFEQLRGRTSNLDRFKTGNAARDDNPILPEVDNLMEMYYRKIAERKNGGVIYLYRPGEIEVIHTVILNKVQEELQKALIDDIAVDDKARAGVVMQGPLQGNPDPDVARISVTLHENDADQLIGNLQKLWSDEPILIEAGNGRGTVTWSRKFTIKARCLLETSQEELEEAREIASTVRSRIEKCLLRINFDGLNDEVEEVSRGILSYAMSGEMVQSGGPGAYDYHIKIRFDVWTTEK